MAEQEKSFQYVQKSKFPLSEQKVIGEFLQAKRAKFEQDKRNPEINKAKYSRKAKKWVHPFSQKGYIQPSVCEIFQNLNDTKCDEKVFVSATKFVKRCLDKVEDGTFDVEGNYSSKNYRIKGAGPPKRAPEVRQCFFDYFIDICCSLKGRLPRKLLIAKAHESYELYCELKEKSGETPDEMKFMNCWLAGWCKEYGVSLKSPNKRFSISHDARKRCIIQFLKNIWTVRYFWLANYKREPNIISASDAPPPKRIIFSKDNELFGSKSVSLCERESQFVTQTLLCDDRC